MSLAIWWSDAILVHPGHRCPLRYGDSCRNKCEVLDTDNRRSRNLRLRGCGRRRRAGASAPACGDTKDKKDNQGCPVNQVVVKSHSITPIQPLPEEDKMICVITNPHPHPPDSLAVKNGYVPKPYARYRIGPPLFCAMSSSVPLSPPGKAAQSPDLTRMSKALLQVRNETKNPASSRDGTIFMVKGAIR